MSKQQLLTKTCVVTGASSGIGAAVAQGLAARGAAVVGFARRFREFSLKRRPEAGTAVEVHLDVTEDRAVEERFAEVGDIDVLVNAAGSGHFGPLARTDASTLRELLDAHVVGSFLCTRAALRSMHARRTGHIVNVLSVAAVRSFSDCGAYTAAKSAQHGLSRVLAEEVRSQGIRVTSLLLGAVDTPIWDSRPGFDRSKMMRPQQVADVIADILRRPGVSMDEVVLLPRSGEL